MLASEAQLEPRDCEQSRWRAPSSLPGATKEMQLVLAVEAELAETGADLKNALLVLLVGEEVELGQLKVLPFLVNLLDLAIDVLLDLLRLLVQLDELASTNSSVVGVEASAAADEVEDSVDVVSRTRKETVLGSRMTARNSLALNLFVAGSLDRVGRTVHRVQGHHARRVAAHGCGGEEKLWGG